MRTILIVYLLMRKIIFTILLTIAASVGKLFAYDAQIGNLYYNLSTISQTATVTYKSLTVYYPSKFVYNENWNITTVDIPASVTYGGTTYTVTSIGSNAFSGCTSLTSVTIPNSITSIGKEAFSGCSSLPEIGNICYADKWIVEVTDKNLSTYTIEEGTRGICNNAFAYCKYMTTITIPNSVTSIGNDAFYGCSSLPIVDNIRYADTYLVKLADESLSTCIIKEGTKFIGNNAFYGCTSLTSVTIPNSVTLIGEQAFNGCTGLTSIAIGNSVTSIGYMAFYGCAGLTSVTIPNSVTSIGEQAFYGCTSLTSVAIGNSVTLIGERAFRGCTGLVSVTLDANEITSKNYSYGGDNGISNIFGTQVQEYILGNSITSIGSYAFSACTGLTSVTIGNSVTSIGSYAFTGSSSLNSILWNANEYEVLDYDQGGSSKEFGPFYDICSNITSFTIGNEVESLPDYLCYGMNNLTDINLPNSVKSIGDKCFYDCVGLRRVQLSNQLEHIGASAFENCTRLNTLNLPNTLTYIGIDAFKNTPFYSSTGEWENGMRYIGTVLVEVNEAELPYYDCTIREGTTAIIDRAFAYCHIGSITIPEGVTAIPNYAFEGCYYLHTIKIPNSVTSIGSGAFSDCTGLTSVTIPNFVTSIGSGAFSDCTGLTSVTIPNSVTSIGNYAFRDCTGLTSITIPNSVTSIGSGAFSGCTGLTSITIPNSVTSIGEKAFNGCTGLTSVTIGNSVTSIGSNAFEDCTSLQEVHISDIAAWCSIKFNDNPLYYTKHLYLNGKEITGDLVIPEGVTSIGNGAFYYCDKLTSVTIPNTVISIGEKAFYSCHNLTSLTIPDLVKAIGSEAFCNCGIKSIVIGNSVSKIGEYAFRRCSLTSVVWNAKKCDAYHYHYSEYIPEAGYDWEHDEYGPFYSSNHYITSFTLGNEVREIPDGLCYGMYNLTSVNIPNNVEKIGKMAFSGCEALKQITIGHNVKEISDNAFDECPNVMTIYSYLETPPAINNTVFAGFGTYKGVDLYVPIGCKANYEAMDIWKEFYIIEGLPDIIDNNLYYMLDEVNQTATLITSSLAELKPVVNGELVIPETVVSNGKTFTVTAIGDNVFKDNSTISTVVIPSTVTQIGDSAFYGSSLTSVVIGGTKKPVESVAVRRNIMVEECYEIGDYAFANCKGLTKVKFLDCVSSIGKGAFKGCSNLKDIYSKMQTPPAIDETVFADCGALKDINLYVPTGMESTYKGMAVWKEFFFKVFVNTYIVTFVDWNGNVISTQEVEEGASAIAPADPERNGYHFTGWDISFANVTADIIVTAQYAEIVMWTLVAKPSDEYMGYVTGGGIYEEGEVVTITAIPYEGYIFVQWSDGNTDAQRTVTVTSDATYTAVFAEQPQAIEQIEMGNPKNAKLLIEGHLYILRDGKIYTATGAEIR